MRLRTINNYFALVCIVFTMVVGCSDMSDTRSSDSCDALLPHLAEGDLLFRRGSGVVGRIVTSVDNVGEYSHVGIVVKRDGEWHVVHAVPHEHDFKGDFDRVKCDPLNHFVDYYSGADIGLYRPQIGPEQVRTAVDNALRLSRMKVEFDHDYDLDDTTRLYCTELVEYVYELAGVSLSEGRRTDISFMGFSGPHIMPSDLTQSTKLKPIF